MLKKLFVHEWKDCWRLVGLMNLIVIGLTLIGTVVMQSDTWSFASENAVIRLTMTLYVMAYIASIAALSLVTVFFFYNRFYKNLYTDQGYLMHTLPVTQHELIWSKTFVALIWQLIGGLVMAISIFSFFFSMLDPADKKNFWSDMFVGLSEIPWTPSVAVIIILFVLIAIVSMFMNVFMGYAAISIGQLFKKQRLLGAIGIYIGLYMLLQMVSSYSMVFVNFISIDTYSYEKMIQTILTLLLVVLLVETAVTTAFYFISAHIMKNQLNLE